MSITLFSRSQPYYYYRIKACETDSFCSDYSDPITVYPAPVTPKVTFNYQQGKAGFKVFWDQIVRPKTANDGPATHYSFEENLGSGWSSVQEEEANTQKEYVSKLPSTYYFRAKACNETTCSVWSSANSVTVTSPLTQCPL